MNFDDHDKHDFPLLRHPVDDESAFTPQALIEAVRAEKGLTSVGLKKFLAERTEKAALCR